MLDGNFAGHYISNMRCLVDISSKMYIWKGD